MNYIKYFCTVIFCMFSILGYSQDLDMDGLEDQFEEILARKFAPEWRFNKIDPGDGSNQNHNHFYYPISIEGFYNKIIEIQGSPPRLTFYGTGESVPINSFDDLATIHIPGSTISASDPRYSWNFRNFRITDYPEKISGNPETFPTYFRCERISNSNDIEISYFLFYAMDYKGSYTIFDIEKGKHRADWEGISIRVSNVNSYDEEGIVNSTIEHIKMSGHGLSKYITPENQNLNLIERTHPQMYIAWGSHPIFPQPGEWHNYDVDEEFWGFEVGDIYDDMFHGNGIVIRSWSDSRKLMNVGNVENPMVKWLNFRGSWGPDGNAKNGSPGSPPSKSFWTSDISDAKWKTWEEVTKPTFEGNPYKELFEPDCEPRFPGWIMDDYDYGVLFKHANWDGLDLTVESNINSLVSPLNDEFSSVLVSGNAELILFEHENYQGNSIRLTNSISNLKDIGWNDIVSSIKIEYPSEYNELCYCYYRVNHVGNCNDYNNFPDFYTLESAIEFAEEGATICVLPGRYNEKLEISKKLIIKSPVGPAIIGQQ